MGMQGPDFLTKKQMKEQVALPKVGVTYDDGSGRRRSFSVGDMGDFGSLDAAFGAAAAGVRRGRNLDLAMSLNAPQGAGGVKSAVGSAVVVEGGTVSLKGEKEGDSRGEKRFFGTDSHGNVGWNDINSIDEPTKGDLVGPALNVEAKADTSKRTKANGSWSYQISRTAFKKNEDTGVIQLYNYFRTVYVTDFGRSTELSDETEVLVGTISGAIQWDKVYCAKPVYGNVNGQEVTDDTPEEDRVVEKIEFATAKHFLTCEKKKSAAEEAEARADAMPSSTPEEIREKNAAIAASNSAWADYNAEKAKIVVLPVGEFSAKPEFSNGILQKIIFGTAYDVQKNAEDATKVKKVETVVGCPYQGS